MSGTTSSTTAPDATVPASHPHGMGEGTKDALSAAIRRIIGDHIKAEDFGRPMRVLAKIVKNLPGDETGAEIAIAVILAGLTGWLPETLKKIGMTEAQALVTRDAMRETLTGATGAIIHALKELPDEVIETELLEIRTEKSGHGAARAVVGDHEAFQAYLIVLALTADFVIYPTAFTPAGAVSRDEFENAESFHKDFLSLRGRHWSTYPIEWIEDSTTTSGGDKGRAKTDKVKRRAESQPFTTRTLTKAEAEALIASGGYRWATNAESIAEAAAKKPPAEAHGHDAHAPAPAVNAMAERNAFLDKLAEEAPSVHAFIMAAGALDGNKAQKKSDNDLVGDSIREKMSIKTLASALGKVIASSKKNNKEITFSAETVDEEEILVAHGVTREAVDEFKRSIGITNVVKQDLSTGALGMVYEVWEAVTGHWLGMAAVATLAIIAFVVFGGGYASVALVAIALWVVGLFGWVAGIPLAVWAPDWVIPSLWIGFASVTLGAWLMLVLSWAFKFGQGVSCFFTLDKEEREQAKLAGDWVQTGRVIASAGMLFGGAMALIYLLIYAAATAAGYMDPVTQALTAATNVNARWFQVGALALGFTEVSVMFAIGGPISLRYNHAHEEAHDVSKRTTLGTVRVGGYLPYVGVGALVAFFLAVTGLAAGLVTAMTGHWIIAGVIIAAAVMGLVLYSLREHPETQQWVAGVAGVALVLLLTLGALDLMYTGFNRFTSWAYADSTPAASTSTYASSGHSASSGSRTRTSVPQAPAKVERETPPVTHKAATDTKSLPLEDCTGMDDWYKSRHNCK